MGASLASPRRHIRELRRHARTHTGVRTAHRRDRTGLWRYVVSGDLATIVTAPVIYSVFVPFALLDLWVTVVSSGVLSRLERPPGAAPRLFRH